MESVIHRSTRLRQYEAISFLASAQAALFQNQSQLSVHDYQITTHS